MINSKMVSLDNFKPGVTNIHILPDDQFNEGFIDYSEDVQKRKNIYVSIPKKEKPRFPLDKISYFKSFEEIAALKEVRSARRIYIHGLWEWRSKLLQTINTEVPITWVLYGVGVYKRLPLKRLYEIHTLPLRYFGKEKMDLLDWVRLFRNWRPTIGEYLSQREALSKIDSIAFWLPHDYESIKDFYMLDIEFLEFAYTRLFPDRFSSPQEKSSISSILLGNSANPTNNHIDAFHRIDKSSFNGKIYCPLSYSGPEGYISKVVSKGKSMFGSRFDPILDYMDKESYYSLLDRIDAALFYHRRQQAGSNVLYFLRSGKPVFFNPASPLLPYFRGLGVDLARPAKDFGSDFDISRSRVQESVQLIKKWLSEKTKKERHERLLNY